MAESSTSARVPSLLRACENCRSRKTRCDKRMPCSSCQTLGTACQPPQSASGYRPRILISSQYENQIHLIQERLSTIEQSVRDGLSAIELRVHRLSLQNHTPATASDLEQNPTQTETPTTHVLSSAIPLVEGDSPFVRQTIHATETAEATLNSLEPGPTGDAVTRLAALKNTLETNCSPQSYDPCLSRCHTQPLNPDGDLPPTCFVVEVVKKIKDHPPITLVGFSWHDMSLIERLCQQVYLPFEQPSAGSTALLHGFMFFILRDLIEEGNPFAKKYDCLSYLEAFKRRFSSALTTYEVVAVPALENIQALLLGAIRALEEGNISLSWTYISSACTMCLTLGFHRRSIVENDHPAVVKEKLHVFWMLYMSDKNLSYTLGRCSNFRDCDIDCDYFPISTNRRLAPWDLANLVCIKLGTLQSKVYDSLYTATARQLVPDTKTQLVEGFAIELQNIRNQARSVGIGESGHRVLLTSFMQINPSEAYFAEPLQVTLASNEFLFHSILTTCYLSIPGTDGSTEISSRCLAAARLSLREYTQTFQRFHDAEFYQTSNYVNWVLLVTSFSPYIVVFVHAIGTNDREDLELLERTVGALEAIKDINRSSQRLYDVCKAFFDVAMALNKAKQTANGLHQRNDGSLMIPSSVDAADLAWADELFDFNMNDSSTTSALMESLLSADTPPADMPSSNLSGNSCSDI